MKMGRWRTDHVMKKHYRVTLSDVEKKEQKKLNRHTLKVINLSSAGHETGHEIKNQLQAVKAPQLTKRMSFQLSLHADTPPRPTGCPGVRR